MMRASGGGHVLDVLVDQAVARKRCRGQREKAEHGDGHDGATNADPPEQRTIDDSPVPASEPPTPGTIFDGPGLDLFLKFP